MFQFAWYNARADSIRAFTQYYYYIHHYTHTAQVLLQVHATIYRQNDDHDGNITLCNNLGNQQKSRFTTRFHDCWIFQMLLPSADKFT